MHNARRDPMRECGREADILKSVYFALFLTT